MQRLAYAGEVMEADDLYLLGSRVYSARLRRFLNPDPASPFDKGGGNRYAYCAGDPVNRSDPSGNSWFHWLLTGFGVVAAAVATVMTAGAAIGAVGAALPSLIMLGTAAALDVVSVVSSVGSIAALALGNYQMGEILGWTAFVSGIASGGMASLAKAAPKALRGAAQSTRGRSTAAELLSHPLDDVTRFKVDDIASAPMESTPWRRFDSDLPPHVHRFTEEVEFPNTVHYAWDNAPADEVYTEVLAKISNDLPHDATIYWHTGLKGKPSGHNFPRNPDNRAHNELSEYVAGRQGAKGQKVNVTSLWEMDANQAKSVFSRPGTHIHRYQFGASDRLLRAQFNLPYTPSVFY